jgi:hypothetical protein
MQVKQAACAVRTRTNLQGLYLPIRVRIKTNVELQATQKFAYTAQCHHNLNIAGEKTGS